MNKYNILKLAAAVCVLALLACGLLVFFNIVHIGLHYANANQYTAGGTELSEAVKNLDIHWTDGAVNIAYHAANTVEISEASPKKISDGAEMRWWLDGDTLRIQYAKSGYFSFHGLEKALTVTLPEDIALEGVRIDVTSGEVNVPELRAGRVKVDLTSGDLALRQSGTADLVELSGTSGNMVADLSEVGKLRVSVTSGDIRATLARAEEVSLSTTSGDIDLEGGDVQKSRLDITSGRIDVALAAFDDLRISATSGDIRAALPSEPGFSAEIDTTSGSFDSAIALTRNGSRYTCGDGSASLTVNTTSGNIILNSAQGK